MPAHPGLPGLLYTVPLGCGRPLLAQASARDSWKLTGKSGFVSCGVLFLSLGSWCTQNFVCALQESVSPVLWKFYNQNALAFKVKFPLPDLEVRESVVGPRTFATVQELLWYNSPVCGSFAWWLSGGDNGDLLQEDLCHTQCLLGLLQPEPLSLWWPLLTRASAEDTQILNGRCGSVSCGVSGSWDTQGFVWVLRVSGRYRIWH